MYYNFYTGQTALEIAKESKSENVSKILSEIENTGKTKDIRIVIVLLLQNQQRS